MCVAVCDFFVLLSVAFVVVCVCVLFALLGVCFLFSCQRCVCLLVRVSCFILFWCMPVRFNNCGGCCFVLSCVDFFPYIISVRFILLLLFLRVYFDLLNLAFLGLFLVS